jgi:hypothetical protein
MNYLRFLQDSRKMQQNNDDGGEGGGAGGDKDKPVTFSQEQLDAAIATAVKKGVADATTAIHTARDASEAGLKKNRDTLKQEKLDLQAKLQENSDSQRMQDGDVKAVTAEIEARVKAEYKEKLAEATGNVDKLQGTIDNNKINGALDAYMNDLKVKSTLREALKAQLLSENEVKLGESGGVMVGDLDVKSFMANWAKTEVSKDFILANSNSGGGGGGSRNTDSQDGKDDMMNLEGADLFDLAHEKTKK